MFKRLILPLRRLLQRRQKSAAFEVQFENSGVHQQIPAPDDAESKRLEAQSQQYAFIVNSSDDAIISKSLDGIVNSWNPAAETIFGYSAEEMIGQPMTRLLPPDRMDEETTILEVIKRGGNVKHFVTVRLRKDAGLIDVSVTISPIRDSHGIIVGASKIARDITEFKAAERRSERLKKFYTGLSGINVAIIHASTEQALFANVSRISVDTGVMSMAWVGVENPVTEQIVPVFKYGNNTGYLDDIVISTNPALSEAQGVTGRAWQNRKSFVNNDTAADPSMIPWQQRAASYGFKSSAAFPILRQGKTYAVFTVYHAQAQVFDAEIVSLLDSMAGEIAFALDGIDTKHALEVSNQHAQLLLAELEVHRHDLEQLVESRSIALHTAYAEQQAIFDAASTGIVLARDRVIIRCNRATELLFGYEPGEMLGRSTVILYGGEAAFREVGETIRAGFARQGYYHEEREVVRKDGSRFWARLRAQAIDSDALDKGIVGTVEDITFERETTQLLKQAKEMAEATAHIKSHFLANMSHEIRTPMNAVLGFCYLLEQRPLDTEARQLVRRVHGAGRALLSIINDILDFSKIEAGRLDIEQQPFRLPDLLDDLAALMATYAIKKKLELVITPPYAVDGLIGDKQRLQQILINLVGNAIKFTEQGEVELRIEVLEEAESGYALCFRVRDTGMGISSEKQTEIFAAFTQADTTISRRYGGSGLGLAISRQLVELMGGKLVVKSQVGEGAEFSFALSLPRYHAVQLSPAHLVNLDLLVADDSAIARESLVYTAKNLGWKVDVVDSGEAALIQVLARWENQCPYDVLLLDWQMPEQDGLATARVIQETFLSKCEARSKAPIVIMVTAYDREELLAQSGLAWVDAVLSKPVTASSLYNVIAGLFDQRVEAKTTQQIVTQTGHQQRIPGVRVLVADDSDFNLELTRRILENEGAVVSLAENGQEALSWLNAHPDSVDLVLMDVQMPVLDGYSATRLIRQDLRWKNLPVVAVSAGVLQDEQNQAIESGMNEFVCKPFDVEQLIAVIEGLAGCRRPETAQPKTLTPILTDLPPPEAEVLTLRFELPGIDVVEGLKQWQTEAVYLTYLQKFIDSYSASCETLAELINQDDMPAALALTHKLKGVAGNLALNTIVEKARVVEATLKTGVFQTETVESLKWAIDQVCSSVLRWSKVANAVPVIDDFKEVVNFPNQTIVFLLEELLQVLDKNSPTIAEPIVLKLQGKVPETVLATIRSQLADFNFRAAETTVFALLQALGLRDDNH